MSLCAKFPRKGFSWGARWSATPLQSSVTCNDIMGCYGFYVVADDDDFYYHYFLQFADALPWVSSEDFGAANQYIQH